MKEKMLEIEARIERLTKYVKEMRWKMIEYPVSVKAMHLILLEINIQSENMRMAMALINLELKKERNMITESNKLADALEEHIINKLISKKTGLPGYQIYQMIGKIFEIVEEAIETIPKNILDNLSAEKQLEYFDKLKGLREKRVA
jgi:hypothetical protein